MTKPPTVQNKTVQATKTGRIFPATWPEWRRRMLARRSFSFRFLFGLQADFGGLVISPHFTLPDASARSAADDFHHVLVGGSMTVAGFHRARRVGLRCSQRVHWRGGFAFGLGVRHSRRASTRRRSRPLRLSFHHHPCLPIGGELRAVGGSEEIAKPVPCSARGQAVCDSRRRLRSVPVCKTEDATNQTGDDATQAGGEKLMVSPLVAVAAAFAFNAVRG